MRCARECGGWGLTACTGGGPEGVKTYKDDLEALQLQVAGWDALKAGEVLEGVKVARREQLRDLGVVLQLRRSRPAVRVP